VIIEVFVTKKESIGFVANQKISHNASLDKIKALK